MGQDLFKKCELERFAEKYARLAMIKPYYRPENMPELVFNKKWLVASQDQRDQTSRCIRDMARVLLIKAGYRRKTVYRSIPVTTGGSMTKQELIKAVAQAVRTAHPDRNVSPVMVEAVLEALGDVAAAELLGGGEIPLPGLGKLKSRDVTARRGRNPRTGETLTIPAHKTVAFAACKALKEAMMP